VTIVYAQCIPLEIVSEALTSTFYLNDFEDVSFHDGIRRSRELNIVPLPLIRENLQISLAAFIYINRTEMI
jgi:hypothetical protein